MSTDAGVLLATQFLISGWSFNVHNTLSGGAAAYLIAYEWHDICLPWDEGLYQW